MNYGTSKRPVESTSGISPLATVALRKGKTILLLGLALVALAGWRLNQLELDTDLAGLLPRNDAAVEAYLRSQELFSAEAVLLLLESLEQEIDPVWGERLSGLAAELDLLAAASTLPFDTAGFEAIGAHGIQLLPPEARPEFLQRLSPEGMDLATRRLRSQLRAPLTPGLAERLRRDPLGLLELLPRPEAMAGARWELREGTLLSADGRALMVFADLERGRNDEAALRNLLGQIEPLQARLREALKEEGLDPESFRLRATGPAVIAAFEAKQLRRETYLSFALSLGLVVLLFALAFRRVGAFLWLTLPLGGAVALALAIGDLTMGPLSFLAASAAVPMVGLGIDFGIHLYTRALERRSDGLSPRQAMAAALEEVSGANFAAAATTGLAFGSLAISAIPGFRQMGLLSILGLALSLAAMTTLFPALLLATGALQVPGEKISRLSGRLLTPWLRFVLRHRKGVALMLCLSALACLPLLKQVNFGAGSYGERLETNPALGAQEELLERFGTHFRASVLMLSGEDPAALAEAHHRSLAAGDELRRQGIVTTILSPFTWIPSQAEQAATLEAAATLGGPTEIAERLRQSLRQNGLNPAGFAEGIADLERSLAGPPMDLETLGKNPDLARMVDRFWVRSDGRIHGGIFFLTADHRYEIPTFEALQEGFGGVDLPAGVQAELVTPRLLSYSLRSAAEREVGPSAGLALLAVASVLGFSLRRPAWVALALLPLLLAVLWLLAAIAALDLSLSVENIAALPLILGIGIDDALHVLHHLKRHPERSPLAVLRESGKAVALTTLTTVLAFASLAFAGHPALRSLGILTGLGVTFCLITTLTVIPAAVSLFPHPDEKAQEPGPESSEGLL